MKITYLGHASLLIESAGKRIIVDPFITPNPKANRIDVSSLNADYILVTHAHQDHIYDVELLAKQNNATIVSNAEIASFYENKGLKAHPMNHGGNWKFDFGELKAVNAIHSSSFPDGSYGGNPMGFLIESDGKSIYIAGDTALTFDMKLIPMRTKLDLAILPIGDNFTMNVDDALIASDFLECDKILGYHYDTFGYIEIDHQSSIDTFKSKNKNLILLEIGASIEV